MKIAPVLVVCCLLSALCLMTPAYYDFYSGWNKHEFFATLGVFFLVLSGGFFYIYQDWQSTFAPRKYLMTSVYALIIVLLAAVGLSPSPDIPRLGAMLLYGVGAFAILVMLELIGYFLQKK